MHTQHILDFLADLKQHNNREWFEGNRTRFEAAKKELNGLVRLLLNGMVEQDPDLVGLEPKECVFRIFRDVRFSHDKSPYKINMGAWMARGGRKSPFAGYYLHLQPGDGSFLAGGAYMPEADLLKSIREAVDVEDEEFLSVVRHPDFRLHFGELGGERLQQAPKGYAKDHPMLEYLRYKSFVAVKKMTDAEVLSPGFPDDALTVYRAMRPLNLFLNRAIEHARAD